MPLLKNLMTIKLKNPFIHRYPELAKEEELVRKHLLCSLEHEHTKGMIKVSRYYNNSFYYAVYGTNLEDCKMALTYTERPVDAYNELVKLFPELADIEWKLMIALIIGDHNPRLRDAMSKLQQSLYENILKILEDDTLIPDLVLRDINIIKASGKYNMDSVEQVISAARRRRLTTTVEWIFNNRAAYQKKAILERIERNKNLPTKEEETNES